MIDATGDGFNPLTTLDFLPITVDEAGNIYVTGFFSDNAFKITAGGTITQIIDSTGDGAGNLLDGPEGIAADALGNVYVAGGVSDNAFKITPGGLITEIIDATGDAVNSLDFPRGIALDLAGNVYLGGFLSDNVFKISPGGTISQIIDATGDGGGNILFAPTGIAVDGAGNVYVAGDISANAFKIAAPTVVIVLDIKPGSDPNAINLGAEGVIPVAILTTSVGDGDAVDFDAMDVDQ